MVKTLHQIELISDSLSLTESQRVRLEPSVLGEFANGDRRNSAEGAIDAAGAVTAALGAPLDFPPLAAAVVPGDHVAIAIDENLPQAQSIIGGVVDSLRQAGIETGTIAVVATNQATIERCRSAVRAEAGDTIQFVVHDPNDRGNLCLLGATRHGDLLVNRTIFDADLVLPIGWARLDDFGAFDGLYPQFCDADTIERFRVPSGVLTEKQHASLAHETNEAGERIGAPIVIRVVPERGESIGAVIAGQARAVAARCRELCRKWWSKRADRRASLVIATVSGGDDSQTWQNIARALAAAERLVLEGGAIAVCSNLARAPGKSLGRLVGTNDLEKAERKILSDHAEDSWPAWELARALQRGPVYFLSQLDEETVEEMGLAPVANVSEIVRLASRHESCLVLDDSQHVVATVSGE